jgi:predicted transcriptional regulator
MKYRSRTDIVAQILEAASGEGANKTKIMYKAYLSHDQLKEYLSILMEKMVFYKKIKQKGFTEPHQKE